MSECVHTAKSSLARLCGSVLIPQKSAKAVLKLFIFRHSYVEWHKHDTINLSRQHAQPLCIRWERHWQATLAYYCWPHSTHTHAKCSSKTRTHTHTTIVHQDEQMFKWAQRCDQWRSHSKYHCDLNQLFQNRNPICRCGRHHLDGRPHAHQIEPPHQCMYVRRALRRRAPVAQQLAGGHRSKQLRFDQCQLLRDQNRVLYMR